MRVSAAILIETIFLLIAFSIYYFTGNVFYIYNFAFIGTSVAVGVLLTQNGHKFGRNIIMLAVGSYLLIYVGIFGGENLLLSGFWYYLFLGVFEAAVIHYLIAKIAGPVIFGRGWCGYACWIAMVLDLLPYKVPTNDRKDWGYVRYVLFVVIFAFVSALFIFKVNRLDMIMFYMFIVGNAVYYILGILLAYKLHDNRAFCKYVCPITVFLKISSYFSILRVKVNQDKCIECGKCMKICPMDVEILNDSRKRKNGTECILCLNCAKDCPKNAIKL